MEKIKLQRLSQKKVGMNATTWGMPWKKGELKRNEQLKVEDSLGNKISSQTKITAYWPDGSVKWTKSSIVCDSDGVSEIYVTKGNPKVPKTPINVIEDKDKIVICTGTIVCTFNKQGNRIIEMIKNKEEEIICTGGILTLINERRHDTQGQLTIVQNEYKGKVSDIKIEEEGPVCAVVRIRGHHESLPGHETHVRGRRFIPFDVRLYFYAGESRIRLVHTFLFDGQPHNDYIRGIGIELYRPMQGELYNRYIRLGGETGLFAESPKLLGVSRITEENKLKYKDQIEGRQVVFNQTDDKTILALLDEAPSWGDYKINQVSSNHYLIEKRTGKECCYIKAAVGKRAMGIGYIGDSYTGGMSIYRPDFWQKYPSALAMKNVTSSEAKVKVWFWSPDASAMDLRHYDTSTHVQSAYEGFDEMRATSYGIANTNEVIIDFYTSTPSNDKLVKYAESLEAPNLFICEPTYYKEAEVFGVWGVEDRSTPERTYMEDKLDAMITYYEKEREQRDWYGFWDYGDIMHSYDEIRHTWKYDMGGFAWQNTELMPNMWLWYAFMRSGKESIYRLAHAMTRHNSEVDMYHLGEYAGLGSRHNVRHWGCGCKEARISMAANHRYAYYLSGDERLGDIIDEVKDADFAVANLDPLRSYYSPSSDYKAHIRVSPDAMAFCSNWLARWERYEDEYYKEKLLKTIGYFLEDKRRFILGGVFGYTPEGTKYVEADLNAISKNFLFCFGSLYIWTELIQVLDDEKFKNAVIELGKMFSDHYPNKDGYLESQGIIKNKPRISMYSTGLGAYAAKEEEITELAEDVWRIVIEGMEPKYPFRYQEIKSTSYPREFKYLSNMSGNSSGQFGTNVIMCLELIGDKMPKIDKRYYEKSSINPWG